VGRGVGGCRMLGWLGGAGGIGKKIGGLGQAMTMARGKITR